MKILHTADLHIGAELSFLDTLSESRKYEILEIFKNICEKCANENIDICLIAGDLFDNNSVAKTFCESVFRFISSADNTRFFYVAGNHDPLNAASPFKTEKLPNNLTVFGCDFETVTLNDIKVRITGKSFAHSSMECTEVPNMPDDELVNILLLHADFGATGSAYNPISHSFVQSCGADYLALGHIHKRTSVEKIGKTYLAYPGCPEGQGFDETGEKGVYIAQLTKNNCEAQFVKCSKRLHIIKKIDLSAAQNNLNAEEIILQNLYSDFGEDYTKNLYKIILVGSVESLSSINTAELLASLKNKLYFVKIKNRLRQQIDLEVLSNELSLKGIFVNKMLTEIQKADSEQQKTLIDALYLGLEAFDSEVAYDED